MRFFFSANTLSGRLSQEMSILVSAFHRWTSSISSYSGARADLVPENTRGSALSVMGRPSWLKPKASDSSAGRPPPSEPFEQAATRPEAARAAIPVRMLRRLIIIDVSFREGGFT